MALGTILPFWPALLFTYLEPLALIMGWNAAWNSPSEFVSRQTPSPSLSTTVPDGALILSYTIGNVFILLGALAIVCTAITRDPRVAKSYLLVVSIADLGHIYASYKILGPSVFWKFNDYNDMMWGNIGVSAFLHINRIATLLGVFGQLDEQHRGV
ncbi:uncharacterized protein EI97DRAFT_108824 [Westerdykella ornata]|uniref:DUF7704 domain-containing protein n=1 Tax=Westerdykella ornata TaxID=318751 RepID=A0A6A6JYE5_WESOR|nr:uncharacterized protein EI97DRAFT_108824 [Westerdykella ornata]KAF2280049.1 hypothetical protein EI97DRAFT_108824 [Westerdykella ornata]